MSTIWMGVAIFLALVLVSVGVLRLRHRWTVTQVEQSLQSQPTPPQFTEAMIAGLPAPVQRYFLHAIALGTPLVTVANLEMRGQFRLARDRPWLPMRADECITSQGFVWQAVIGQGLSQFRGADYYFNGAGRMQFFLLGLLPIVDVHNADTARSSIGRFVAEWFWLPSALLLQPEAQWQVVAEDTIAVSFQFYGEPICLRLVIDATGRLLQMSCSRWGNITDDQTWAYLPFGGTFPAEQTWDGFTIPSQIQAGWWFGTERYLEFFQATVDRVELSGVNS